MAAAATGHLPDPVQHAVSHTASHVGLSLPDPSDEKTVEATDEQSQGNRSAHQDDVGLVHLIDRREHDIPDDDCELPTIGAVPRRRRHLHGGGRPRRPPSPATQHGGSVPTSTARRTTGCATRISRGLANGNPKNPARRRGATSSRVRRRRARRRVVLRLDDRNHDGDNGRSGSIHRVDVVDTSTSSTTSTTAESTTVQAEGKPHGGGNSDGAGAGDGSTRTATATAGNSNGNGNGNGG